MNERNSLRDFFRKNTWMWVLAGCLIMWVTIGVASNNFTIETLHVSAFSAFQDVVIHNAGERYALHRVLRLRVPRLSPVRFRRLFRHGGKGGGHFCVIVRARARKHRRDEGGQQECCEKSSCTAHRGSMCARRRKLRTCRSPFRAERSAM